MKLGQLLMSLGTPFILAGILANTFSIGEPWVFIICVLIFCVLTYSGYRIHMKNPEYLAPLPKEDRRKKFITIVVSIFVGCAVSPFILHYQHPKFSWEWLIIIPVISFFIATGTVWYSFVRHEREIEQAHRGDDHPTDGSVS